MANHDKTVSVSEAAAMLHVSEKTVRRRIKAGELTASKQPLDGGGIGWRVLHANLIYTETDNAVDSVPEVETEARRNRDGQRSGQAHAQAEGATDNAMDVPDNGADSSVTRAGSGIDRAMDNRMDASAPNFIPFADDKKLSDRDADEIARQREEIIFLRGLVEQHQRSEAELRAALRKALEIAPRQLTQGTPVEAATPTGATAMPETPDAPQIAQANTVPDETMDAVKSPANRAPRPLWKVMFGIR